MSALAATDGTGAIQLFLSCHHDDWDVDEDLEVTVRLAGVSSGMGYGARRMVISSDRANAHSAWQELGRPQSPGQHQIELMSMAALLEAEPAGQTAPSVDGEQITVKLPAHSVCLLSLDVTPRSV